jgi:A/G-specific adenine glycosylase
VDGNVERVLARVFDIGIPVRRGPGKTLLRALAEDLLACAPAGRAGDFNQGLMELGEVICRKKSLCPQCPVREVCDASRLDNARQRPVPEERVRPGHCETVAGVLRLGDRVLVQRRRLDDRVWAGLWEFPGGMIERGESPEQAVAREFMEELELGVRARESVCTICHSYTSYRLRLHCFLLEPLHPEQEPAPVPHEACAWKWATAEELRALPLPAPHRRLAEILTPSAGAGNRGADGDGKRV